MILQERFLYILWKNNYFGKFHLKTEDGKNVRIVFPGRWNRDTGPDFRNAVIQIDDREQITGDIEIDYSEKEWRAHGHIDNPEFFDVQFHVIFHNKSGQKYTENSQGIRIPVITLSRYIDEEFYDLWNKFAKTNNLQVDKDICPNLPINNISKLLINTGKKRFLEKSGRLRKISPELSFDMLLIKATFENMGYSKNTTPFQRLFNLIDFREMKTRPFINMIRYLFELSGLFLPKQDTISKYINDDAWNDIQNIKPLKRTDCLIPELWKFARIRPQNSPILRLIQLAVFLDNTRECNIAKIFENILLSGKSLTARLNHLREFFVPGSDAAAMLSDKFSPLGLSRLKDIVFNSYLPIFLLRNQDRKEVQNIGRLMDFYLAFPKLGSNNIVKYMLVKLDSPEQPIEIKKEVTQQGLIYLYKNYCSLHDCEGCLIRKASIK